MMTLADFDGHDLAAASPGTRGRRWRNANPKVRNFVPYWCPERDAINREYGTLFASISDALFEADPVGINFDEFDFRRYPESYPCKSRRLFAAFHSASCGGEIGNRTTDIWWVEVMVCHSE
jgi:hypothetical protein